MTSGPFRILLITQGLGFRGFRAQDFGFVHGGFVAWAGLTNPKHCEFPTTLPSFSLRLQAAKNTVNPKPEAIRFSLSKP